ncbi:hypothetical protein EG68_06416 [Paragonimus skrjabini miyazakii]|uniref:Uncharacterized protein n=1 Tax=Paragonimus skrjabini miyazakii TaxID=59628 RepID=A0A8S9YT72_9TREM|nr:hypothetical protein EG68_06416 [Paragonimus skrjabini miyazakii]
MMSTMVDVPDLLAGKNSYHGRRHYSLSHRKTSLFGSENEEQYPVDSNLNCRQSNGSQKKKANMSEVSTTATFSEQIGDRPTRIPQEHDGVLLGNDEILERRSMTKNGTKQSESVPNSIMNDNEEITDLIMAAKLRAQRRENERREAERLSDEKLLIQDKPEFERPLIKKRNSLQAPWYTDPNEGIGSNDFGRRSKTHTQRLINHSTVSALSTSQHDYHKYTNDEIKESRQPQVKHGNKESVPWYSEYAIDRLVGSKGDGPNLYRKSSATIGESYMKVFGVNGHSANEKQSVTSAKDDRGQVAKSSLRNTPYAHHN